MKKPSNTAKRDLLLTHAWRLVTSRVKCSMINTRQWLLIFNQQGGKMYDKIAELYQKGAEYADRALMRYVWTILLAMTFDDKVSK